MTKRRPACSRDHHRVVAVPEGFFTARANRCKRSHFRDGGYAAERSRSHSVMVRTDLAAELPKVVADRVQLQQY